MVEDIEKGIIEHANSYGIFKLLGIEVLESKPGRGKLRIRFREEITQPSGVAHGGIAATLADAAVAMALLPDILPRGGDITTIEMKINYFKPFDKGEMVAEARIIHKGKTIAVGEVDITDGKGTPLGKALMTYRIFLPSPSPSPSPARGEGNE